MQPGIAKTVLAACLTVLTSVAAAQPTVEQVAVVKGLEVPECLVTDPASGFVYISNVEAGEGEYWSKDGKGFISRMTADGEMKELRWLDSTADAPIHGPKGMCLLDGYLYIADITRLLRYPLKGDGPLVEISVPGAKRLNDLATDGKSVYVSDTELGRVHKVDPKGGQTTIKAPESINGITFHEGRMFAVSWALHDVYELDPAGDGPPKPFGLADHFEGLDAVEVLEDGTFIVSDFLGNKVCAISADRNTVHTLIELETPADIGIHRAKGLLYIPKFMKDEAVIVKLK